MFVDLLATATLVSALSAPTWSVIKGVDSVPKIVKDHAVLYGAFPTFDECESTCAAHPNCTMWTWNEHVAPHHCFGGSDTKWVDTTNSHCISGCLVGVVKGCPAPQPPTPTIPTPPPAPTPAPAPAPELSWIFKTNSSLGYCHMVRYFIPCLLDFFCKPGKHSMNKIINSILHQRPCWSESTIPRWWQLFSLRKYTKGAY